MSLFYVKPNGPLRGTVTASGSKNAVLPIMCACLLTDEICEIYSVPPLLDVYVLKEIMESMGVWVQFDEKNEVMKIHAKRISSSDAKHTLWEKIRASFLVAGPVCARTGKVKVPFPGGCKIGSRPVDLHIKGFENMGMKIRQEFGFIEIKGRKLKGTEIYLDFPSVGATENLMMAAVLCEGATVIENAASEPEIVDLAKFLNKMGASVTGAGSTKIVIKGVESLHGAKHRVIPDRIEVGTFMAAAAVTRGDVTIKNVCFEHIRPAAAKIEESGVIVEESGKSIRINAEREVRSFDIKTLPFPGFPTDMQAIFMSILSTAKGTGMITETVFENRFMHVAELKKMGADIKTDGRTAVVEGVKKLSGAKVRATDLRAGAALIVSALAAEGDTEIGDIYHIERGYCDIDKKLMMLGAEIEKRD
ncbi:MAG: UDP-N-acetylglucosamine 1-carboxyvinyltransferase [Firmicutes bacterium]|nr:UDP-N-acetylglucosamine 1-carboxyvinyltransferase [Bacillota bacterium]